MFGAPPTEDPMLYSLHGLQRSLLAPFAAVAERTAELLTDRSMWPLPVLRANLALFHRLARPYERTPFGISEVTAHGHTVTVTEETLVTRPFCRLVRFARHATEPTAVAALARDPRMLVCAPLSGHHPTLLRDTIATLLVDHDVYLTDWTDAREVPVAAGPFHLDDYVAYIQEFIRHLGATELNVLAVCQPTVPVLAAISLLAARGEATPRTLTLMGGPVDARVNPTAVNTFANEKPYTWFERNMIHRVPGNHPGAGRAVYPGFIQLTAFVMMNPTRHLDAYRNYWLDQVKGGDAVTEGGRVHERFYNEYNAVLDMDAAYYLDTVRTVFQEFSLARGTWDVGGERVRPDTITTTALYTIEGALDDISGLGQTSAAHALCAGVPDARKRHLIAADCGHYGLFSGHRWRETIYPTIRDFVRTHAAEVGA
ncbi:MAG: esterase [Myxococcales bacterium]|nr:esterase [Myxococcales bacterium]